MNTVRCKEKQKRNERQRLEERQSSEGPQSLAEPQSRTDKILEVEPHSRIDIILEIERKRFWISCGSLLVLIARYTLLKHCIMLFYILLCEQVLLWDGVQRQPQW